MNNRALTIYTSALIDELAQIGLRTCVISPGSRSTPLALLMAEHTQLNTYVNVDERSAAFFALGAAKSSGEPSVLVCTSGSAAANYAPAIVEAAYSRVPLLVLTADRPHELRDVGAPQAINQMNMYSNYTKAFFEAAIPEDNNAMVTYVRHLVRRAVAAALKAPSGPVQINIPLREPLIPDLSDPSLFTYGRSKFVPRMEIGKLSLADSVLNRLAMELASYKNGIIVCGDQTDPTFADTVIDLAEQLQFPILADPLSQLRLCGRRSEWIIDGYDAFLKSEAAVRALKPEVVIRFGAMPVSKSLLIAIKGHWQEAFHLVVDGGADWRDPAAVTDEMLYCDETTFCREIHARVPNSASSSLWSQRWKQINEQTRRLINQIQNYSTISEGRIYYELNDLLLDNSQLFIANSMPIRDVDTFVQHSTKRVRLLCNRGANGIDGTISTALGVALNGKPTLLITGDLSFFHDLNGLATAQLNELHLTIILVNNNGGGIFSFLPQAESENSKKQFERLFVTSLNLSFEHAAKLYGADYVLIESWEQFQIEVAKGLQSKGIQIIEVQTAREENVAEHLRLWDNVKTAIEPILEEVEG